MRKANKTLRVMGYAAPVALTFALAAPAMGHPPTDENLWSAKKEDTAWTTRYDECWKSKTGPGDLAPCAVKKLEPAKKVVAELNFNLNQYVVPNGVADIRQVDEIDKYIDQLKATPDRERVTIVGHTSADGSDDYNMKLGQRRAEAVRDYFIRRGYPEEYLAPAESRGEYDMRPGYDPYSVAQRRVEFHKTKL
ncbi:OmpA family protein [Candidatus Thiosymbion oneisti]|uniref:OmpA family protein n=2 Tax=Candidatus Thiosymbion oneisti TaxID=589554 RepID=UPI00106063AB|nr:OmpA family protein [Candidatus Thiosymbion oneisti]